MRKYFDVTKSTLQTDGSFGLIPFSAAAVCSASVCFPLAHDCDPLCWCRLTTFCPDFSFYLHCISGIYGTVYIRNRPSLTWAVHLDIAVFHRRTFWGSCCWWSPDFIKLHLKLATFAELFSYWCHPMGSTVISSVTSRLINRTLLVLGSISIFPVWSILVLLPTTQRHVL